MKKESVIVVCRDLNTNKISLKMLDVEITSDEVNVQSVALIKAAVLGVDPLVVITESDPAFAQMVNSISTLKWVNLVDLPIGATFILRNSFSVSILTSKEGKGEAMNRERNWLYPLVADVEELANLKVIPVGIPVKDGFWSD